jgi:hypothetical protein
MMRKTNRLRQGESSRGSGMKVKYWEQRWSADIPVRQRARLVQPHRVFVHRLFALRAQAERMSALRGRVHGPICKIVFSNSLFESHRKYLVILTLQQKRSTKSHETRFVYFVDRSTSKQDPRD